MLQWTSASVWRPNRTCRRIIRRRSRLSPGSGVPTSPANDVSVLHACGGSPTPRQHQDPLPARLHCATLGLAQLIEDGPMPAVTRRSSLVTERSGALGDREAALPFSQRTVSWYFSCYWLFGGCATARISRHDLMGKQLQRAEGLLVGHVAPGEGANHIIAAACAHEPVQPLTHAAR